MKDPKDNFSSQAGEYAQFRPHYPDALFDFLWSLAPGLETAWDVGTGNGQVATRLAEKFSKVYASDISPQQLQNAPPAGNITYLLSRAEQTDFPDAIFDLITVAQAIHWFDFGTFYQEVVRTAKPGGILGVWGYGLLQITPEIDAVILDFYRNVVGRYWDSERRYVDEAYQTIPFPFEEIMAPPFQIMVQWQRQQLLGYLHTWSSVQQFRKERHTNPVAFIENQIADLWPMGVAKEVSFPIFLRIGRIQQ